MLQHRGVDAAVPLQRRSAVNDAMANGLWRRQVRGGERRRDTTQRFLRVEKGQGLAGG